MAASPRVKLIGSQSSGFSKWVLFIIVSAVTVTIIVLSWWKISYERQQRFLSDAHRTEMTAQAVKKCGSDARCVRLELLQKEASADNFVRSLQDETADWTFFLLLLGVVTGGVSILGLIWIRASLLAAREANSINAAAIITSERAWVFSRVETHTQLEEYHGEVMQLDIRVVNKNTGKSAAINVHTNIHSSDGDHIDQVMDLLAKESLQSDSSQNGVLLAPGDEYSRPWMWSSHDRFDIQFDGSVRFIVGCVTYETLFDDQKHQTGFVFCIAAPDRSDGPAILVPWSGSFAT
ncbi:hypothetical protein RHEph01_gp054 [Rhizobium phage RHEph01]|uniref:Transmembrane protein n=1 Tax=Rhizobium phage RHEph01 TaxID=1220601 RepID=L7TMN9_9CAUD|nr:hypothetical protein HOQ88_gp40 [Rhizobium phage RHEph01]AGC35564.1 hypothetical protein RHEph01_gp054 [Rhizobium phage RHEph01]